MESINQLKSNLSHLCSLTRELSIQEEDTNMIINEELNNNDLSKDDLNDNELNNKFGNNFDNNKLSDKNEYRIYNLDKCDIFNLTSRKKKKASYNIIWNLFDITHNNHIIDRIDWKDKYITLLDDKEYIHFKMKFYYKWNLKNTTMTEFELDNINNMEKIKTLFDTVAFTKLFDKKIIENMSLSSDNFMLVPFYNIDNNIFIGLINKNKKYGEHLYNYYLSKMLPKSTPQLNEFNCINNNIGNCTTNYFAEYTLFLDVINGLEINYIPKNDITYYTFNVLEAIFNEFIFGKKYYNSILNLNYKFNPKNSKNRGTDIIHTMRIPLFKAFFNAKSYSDKLLIIWNNYTNKFDMILSNLYMKLENELKKDNMINKEKNKLTKENDLKINQIKMNNNKIIKKYKKHVKYQISKNKFFNGKKNTIKDSEIKKIFKKNSGSKYIQYKPNKILDIKESRKEIQKSFMGKNFDDFVANYSDLIIN